MKGGKRTAHKNRSVDNLTFMSDSEIYDDIPDFLPDPKGKAKEGAPGLKRGNTMTGLRKKKKSTSGGSDGGSRWAWGLGKSAKAKQAQAEAEAAMADSPPTPTHSSPIPAAFRLDNNSDALEYMDPHPLPPAPQEKLSRSVSMSRKRSDGSKPSTSSNPTPIYLSRRTNSADSPVTRFQESQPPTRSNSQSTQASKRSARTQDSELTTESDQTKTSKATYRSDQSGQTSQSSQSGQSSGTNSRGTGQSGSSANKALPSRAQLHHNDSSSTLIGSALERKINDVDSYKGKIDTKERLEDLRNLMKQHSLDYYVIPSEDAHQTEYVAECDKRREWISGFTGSAGQAIVTLHGAYLVTDSRYWLQAKSQLDGNWTLVAAGSVKGPRDWIEWLAGRAKDVKIGIDARMISYEKATTLKARVEPLGTKLHYPPQNLIDLIWKDKLQRPKNTLFLQDIKFTGRSAMEKLEELKKWIDDQPAYAPVYSKSTPQAQMGMLVTALDEIAWLLNLRGTDIPYNPLFHAYLFVGSKVHGTNGKVILFVDKVKIVDEVARYLDGMGIERRDYGDVWGLLRKREWGEGKVILSPSSPYAVALMLTHFRVTILPSNVEVMMSIKNETEIEGLKRAYLRDGLAFVRFLAWLEAKLAEGYDITEYEAGLRITEFRRKHKMFQGLAYKNISATGPNAALPHYQARKDGARMIERDTPYLIDSGGQYLDGTCDTTRTLHFGRPSAEHCEAYTRVLQGHIAIETAIFPEGTSGEQLDVLARKALWKDGLNYMHGTGHGFGSFLTVHEGKHSFSSRVPLVQGHVLTNEPGYYAEGKFGIRIESALLVKRVKPKNQFGGSIWLGFERFTCVPIQTRMVKDNMLTKDEKQWIKDHNQKCYERLSPMLKEDKRALKWLKKEADRGIGIASAPGGIMIDWD